jgi:hypothetical protein
MIVASTLVFPVHETLSLVRSKANDSLGLATTAPQNAAVLSSYLASRTAGVRYELAAEDPLSLAPLVSHDQRPILPLTSFAARPLTSLAQLRADIAAGRVRYAIVSRVRCAGRVRPAPGCVPTALWIRQQGIDVTSSVGLVGRERLYLLTPDRAG